MSKEKNNKTRYKQMCSLFLCLAFLAVIFSGCNYRREKSFHFDLRAENFRTYNFANSNFEMGNSSFFCCEWGGIVDYNYITMLKLQDENFRSKTIANDYFNSKSEIKFDVFYDDGYLYFITNDDNNSSLYCFNEETEEIKKIFSVDIIVEEWLVAGDYLIFSKDGKLSFKRFDGGEKGVICDQMISFAVCGNLVRYISSSEDKLSVNEFNLDNKETTLLNDIELEIEDPQNLRFSYGKNTIVISDYNWNQLYVFTLENNKLEKYTLPGLISKIECSPNFAFISLVDSQDKPLGVYRFNIFNGEKELLFNNEEICLNLIAVNDMVAYASFDGSFINKPVIQRLCINSDGIAENSVIYTW